jgi:hypothetical protein
VDWRGAIFAIHDHRGGAVAMVRRIGRSVRCAIAADRWTGNHFVGICSLRLRRRSEHLLGFLASLAVLGVGMAMPSPHSRPRSSMPYRPIRLASRLASTMPWNIAGQSLIVRSAASENPQKGLEPQGRSYCDRRHASPSPASSSA